MISNKKVIVALAASIALPLIGYFEGRSLVAYLDPIGIPTICDGATKGVKLGDTATPAQCDARTTADLLEAISIVQGCSQVTMNPNQLAAFASFTYNVGSGKKGAKDGFCILKNGKQPTIIKRLQAGDYQGACDGLLAWVNAGGKKLNGLVKRRQAERELCLKPWVDNE